ncbi:MAG: hypothetical protein L6282_11705 [Candidatus Methanoperedenaceae archaeon]|nr:hypothetical protein [Candidatus Methanoperedenaceae archaeon]
MKFEYNLEYPNELDDPISEECYICGRSNDDLKTLTNRIVTEINTKIISFENALVRLTEKYNNSIQEILESTKENNFLDVQIKTILEDRDTFRKKIPHIDEILKPFLDYGRLINQEHGFKNFRDLYQMYKDNMENNPDKSPAIVKIKEKIADLNKLKLRLQDQEIKDKVETPLLKRIIRIDGGFNSTHLEVAICPICACLVERKGDLTYTIKGK